MKLTGTKQSYIWDFMWENVLRWYRGNQGRATSNINVFCPRIVRHKLKRTLFKCHFLLLASILLGFAVGQCVFRNTGC